MSIRLKSGPGMESREQAEQAAVGWIARRETGPWSDEDAATFDAWLSGSMTRRVAYYRLKKTWLEAGRLKALGAGPLPDRPLYEGPSSDVFDTGDVPAARQARGGAVRYVLAACIVLSVTTGLFLFRSEIFGFGSYKTNVGGLTAVPMPDGSRITLNTDSKLRISMDDRERRIELQRGEAFFEVAKDPGRPFIVAADDKQVIAVGTRFSVHRTGDDLRVSVTEGAVRLIASPAGQPGGVLLVAGSIARAQSTGVIVQHEPVPEVEQKLSWRAGILTFRNTPLVDAVAEFNRYNERQMFIEDPSLAAIEVGGIFRSTDLDPFIRLIEEGLSIKVSQEGKRILLSAR